MSRGGPLAGIRVLDATRALAGPFCTTILGDLGADVIKLEMPGAGDETRYRGPPFAADAGPTLIGYNRNKRSVAIHLHTAEGRATCLALAGKCAVFVEKFPPAPSGVSASTTPPCARCARKSFTAPSAVTATATH